MIFSIRILFLVRSHNKGLSLLSDKLGCNLIVLPVFCLLAEMPIKSPHPAKHHYKHVGEIGNGTWCVHGMARQVPLPKVLDSFDAEEKCP
jgi:hypothetical protein